MATSWAAPSQCYKYRHTSGQVHAVSPVSPAWQEIRNPADGMRVFEALADGQQPDINRDHVVMNSAAGVNDQEVPSISAKADMWDQLASEIPGMSPNQVFMADLLGKSDAYLARKLNSKLNARGVQSYRHLSEAFSRMASQFISVGERAAMAAAVEELFLEYQMAPTVAMQQWDKLMEWWEQRIAFAHPLGGRSTVSLAKLAELSTAISQGEEFAEVRAAGQFLIAAVQRMVTEHRLAAA